tara:strand:+ start:1280 stop:1642 length:363 start_codon:yes stop_codon:yes gene_type:complete
MSSDLLVLAKGWIEFDDAIREQNKTVKNLREQKEALSEQIIKIMQSKNVDSLDLPNETISIKTQIQYSGINQDFLVKTLTEIFDKPYPNTACDFAKHTTNELLENRNENEKSLLKRTKKK